MSDPDSVQNEIKKLDTVLSVQNEIKKLDAVFNEKERLMKERRMLEEALAKKTLESEQLDKLLAEFDDMDKMKGDLRKAKRLVTVLEKEREELKQTWIAMNALETASKALATAKWIIDQERALKRARTDSDE